MRLCSRLFNLGFYNLGLLFFISRALGTYSRSIYLEWIRVRCAPLHPFVYEKCLEISVFYIRDLQSSIFYTKKVSHDFATYI